MKKQILIASTFICLLFLVTNSSFAQPNLKSGVSYVLDENGQLTETRAPLFQFETERYDFKQIPEGPKVDYDFAFKNIGQTPLIISDVKVLCGCTTSDWTVEPILPGESGVIKVTYSTKDRPGKFFKTVTVLSNAHTRTKKLVITGEVGSTKTATTVSPALLPSKESSTIDVPLNIDLDVTEE